MRLFVAVIVEDRLRQKISSVQQELKGVLFNIKPVEEVNIHLTLRFLGELPEERLSELESCLGGIQEYPVFEMTLKGVGAFPSVKSPRVVWVGCENPGGTLPKIYRTLEDNIVKMGLPADDHEFQAHITIARNKFPSARGGSAFGGKYNKGVEDLINKYAGRELGKQIVNRITLFQSVLTLNGPIYTNIRDFNLTKC